MKIKKNKKKIIFGIKSLSTVRGGAERVLVEIVQGLVHQYNVSIVTFDHRDAVSLYKVNPIIKIENLDIGHSDRKSTFFETIKRIQALRRYIRKERPDVAIGFMHSMFVPISFALLGTGIPVIASEHIVPKHYQDKKWEYFLLIISSFFVKRITVLSESIKKSYPEFMQKKMKAITNPVALPIANSKKSRNERIILNVGRLSPQKDQGLLIDAFALISEKYPEWSLRIVGEGALRSSLESKINDRQLQSKITLTGEMAAIENEYENADMFVLSSAYESFGLALVEAMSFGLPVIGFADCPGVNEIIEDEKNGLLIQGEGSSRARILSEAMESLMKSEGLRKEMGRSGVRSSEKFHPDYVCKLWSDLIESVA